MTESIKNKTARCYTDIGGKGDMISCEMSNSATNIHLHPSEIRINKAVCEKSDDNMICKTQPLRKFKAGQMWSDDFDYCGMLRAGKRAKVSDSAKELNLLFDSFEDVNYHEESAPLIDAIELLKKNKKIESEEKIKEFNKLSGQRAKGICE